MIWTTELKKKKMEKRKGMIPLSFLAFHDLPLREGFNKKRGGKCGLLVKFTIILDPKKAVWFFTYLADPPNPASVYLNLRGVSGGHLVQLQLKSPSSKSKSPSPTRLRLVGLGDLDLDSGDLSGVGQVHLPPL